MREKRTGSFTRELANESMQSLFQRWEIMQDLVVVCDNASCDSIVEGVFHTQKRDRKRS